MAKRSKNKKALKKVEDLRVDAPSLVAPQRLPWFKQDWFFGLILVLAVFLAYSPVWWAGYIWDDDLHLTTNPCIIGPLGLKEIWADRQWQPFALVMSAFWVEHALWGLAPLPYHLVNVVEQAGCAVLLWRVLRSLQIPGAWLGAALWALHPLQVESVAWISEMKNTQSCLFYLLTILFFVRWLKKKDLAGQNGMDWNYPLALLFANLAMASKSSTLVLPVVLGLCAWWMEGLRHGLQLRRLAPFFLLSVLALVVTLWPQDAPSFDPQWARSWPERIATVGDTIWFYLFKLIWPHPLMAIYPRWEIDGASWISYLPLAAALIVLIVFWRKRDSWSRPCFFALSYYLVALSPFLGLIDQSFWRYSLVEDHLQYLAGMGPLVLAGAGMVKLANLVIPNRPVLQSSLAAGLLIVLGIISWQRTSVYENDETLWNDTLAKNPNCWGGYNALGLALLNKGRVDEAITQLQKALQINPSYAQAHNNLGNAFLQKGQLEEAMAHYQKGLEINPNDAEAHSNLGIVLFRIGQVDKAMAEFQTALDINPYYFFAYYNLGLAYSQRNQFNQAITQYQKALQINPNYAGAHNNLGTALLKEGRMEDAILQFQEAVQLNPHDSAAQNNLSKLQAILKAPPAKK